MSKESNALADLERILAAHPHLAALLRGPTDPRDVRTVAEVVGMYLEGSRQDLAERTYENRQRVLAEFVEEFGARKINEGDPFVLKQWIFAQKNWKAAGMRASVNVAIQRAFNWAVENRIIRENSFRGVRLREEKNTGRDMTPAEFDAIYRFPPQWRFRGGNSTHRIAHVGRSPSQTASWSPEKRTQGNLASTLVSARAITLCSTSASPGRRWQPLRQCKDRSP